jgi:hypothetical protein
VNAIRDASDPPIQRLRNKTRARTDSPLLKKHMPAVVELQEDDANDDDDDDADLARKPHNIAILCFFVPFLIHALVEGSPSP